MSDILVPTDLQPLAQERRMLWSEFDQSQADKTALQELAKHVPKEVEAESLKLLTSAGTPAQELFAAARGLKQSVANIEQVQAAIQAAENEIQAINTRFRNMMAGGAIGLVILIVIVVASLAGY